MKDLITIVVPVYNAQKYVKKCLNSILAQTYKNIEVIIINDGSKDDSLKVLKECAKKDRRIKVYDQKNIGAALTRNRGLELATGKYISFVDADDWVEKDFIETLLKEASAKDDIIISGYQKYYNDTITKRVPSNVKWDIYKFSATWGKLYRRDFLIKNNNFYNKRLIMEDVEFNINCFINGAKYKIIDYAGYVYYINDTSVTSTSKDNHEQLEYAIELFRDINNNAQNKKSFAYKEEKESLINFYILHYMYILNMCCKKASLAYLKKTTKEFVLFLNSLDDGWYKIKNQIGETKKNALAIKLFKAIHKFKIQSLFFGAYVLKNKF